MGRKAIRNLTLLLVVLFTAGAGFLVWAIAAFDQAGPLEEETAIVLPRGASVARIAQILSDQNILGEPALFQFVVRTSGQSSDLKAGEYLFPARASMREVVALITSGKTVVRRLTIAEGLAVVEVLEIIRTANGLAGPTPDSLPEGSLLPETYHYTYGDTRIEVIRRMQQAQLSVLRELWVRRADDLPFDSIEEAVVLASIVEKETALPEERPRIAGVFVNRLRKGMRLQSDPTVVYAVSQGRPLGRRLTRADLNIESPYNTYRRSGLPPAPIANPGRASLEAVLQPAQTNELYFVADGSGGHAFAETLDQHQQNVRRWRQIRRQQD